MSVAREQTMMMMAVQKTETLMLESLTTARFLRRLSLCLFFFETSDIFLPEAEETYKRKTEREVRKS